ncbi:MAG: uroporphyrinogen decarboxylase family protein [Eubacteriales bacterium]
MPNYFYDAMTWNYPKEIPVSVGLLPAAWKKYGDDLRDVIRKFPQLFGDLADRYDLEKNTPSSYHTGSFKDEWGCEWENIEEGMESIVTGHPVKTREDIRTLQIPPNRDGRIPHGFMYLRLLDLRGFEEAMMDFAEEPEELQMLIDKVLEYNCIQINAVVERAGDYMGFGDDLGMQNGLAMGAPRWRKYMYPCYKKMYDIVHSHGKLVYMHTDGRIVDIIGDLKDAGVNMLNPQYRANGLDDLVRTCKGKVPIHLDLDRQLFPFASKKDIEDHIRECVEAFYMPEGGFGLSLELNMEVPLDIIETAIAAVDKYRFYKK